MTIYTANCQLGGRASAGEIYIANSCFDEMIEHTQITTAAFDVTNPDGQEISGLTIGDYYYVEAYNGPFHRNAPDPDNCYEYSLRDEAVDSGAGETISGGDDPTGMGYDSSNGYVNNPPDWANTSIWVNTYYIRCYWQAHTTSVWIGVWDTPDNRGHYGDNSGTLSYRLYRGYPPGLYAYGCRLN